VGLRFNADVHMEMTMPFLLAQCVMCFRTASSQQLARAHVLNEGIFMLGIPPMLILLGFGYLAYRYRNSCRTCSRHDAEMEGALATVNVIDEAKSGGMTHGEGG
jgi:hypothetical protein